DIPRTDYAVLLSTRYRHALLDLAAGRPGVEETLGDIQKHCQDTTPGRIRPLEKVPSEAAPALVDGGDPAELSRALQVSLQGGVGGQTVIFGRARVRSADLRQGLKVMK